MVRAAVEEISAAAELRAAQGLGVRWGVALSRRLTGALGE